MQFGERDSDKFDLHKNLRLGDRWLGVRCGGRDWQRRHNTQIGKM